MRPHHLASEVKLSLCELALAPAHLTVRRLGTVAAPLLQSLGNAILGELAPESEKGSGKVSSDQH